MLKLGPTIPTTSYGLAAGAEEPEIIGRDSNSMDLLRVRPTSQIEAGTVVLVGGIGRA